LLLFDAYGNPIQSSSDKPAEPSPIKEDVPAQTANPKSTLSRLQSVLHLISRYAGWIFGLVGTVSAMLAFLVFRPNIKVEPTSTMNSSDPFSEEFRVINDGAFEITQVHYACAITFIDSGQPDADTVFNESNPVMVPIAPHVNAIERNGSSTAECDFFARFGPELKRVRIEMVVFYKSLLFQGFVTQKFSATRDSQGNVVWTHGSFDNGPFDGCEKDKHPHCAALLFPFQSVRFNTVDPNELAKQVIEDEKHIVNAGKGYRWIAGTAINGNAPPY
jgi:hypothetical protein